MLLRLHSTFYINYFCNLFVISSSLYSRSFHLRTGFLRYCPILYVLVYYYSTTFKTRRDRIVITIEDVWVLFFYLTILRRGGVIGGYYISCFDIYMDLVKFSFLRVGQCFGIF